jgi:hypothetical protein
MSFPRLNLLIERNYGVGVLTLEIIDTVNDSIFLTSFISSARRSKQNYTAMKWISRAYRSITSCMRDVEFGKESQNFICREPFLYQLSIISSTSLFIPL